MKINPKSQKGAITLIVLVTMLFLIAFLMSMYIRISNKAQTSAETTEEIAKKYNNIGEANDIYNSYFANSDVIPIYTVEQLKKIGSGEKIDINGKIYTFTTNGYYTLMDDLDLGGYYDETAGTWAGTQWEPLPLSDSNGTQYRFTGTLDGLGHEIKGLYINDEELNNQGLFGILTGTVKNLSIEKSYIKAKSYVGAIAGKNEGTIKNCYNTGSIIGETNITGGYFKSITTGEQIEVWGDSVLDENAYFVSGKYTATAPKGFTVSKNVFEQTIEEGMVIQDADGNEFVWVPVTNINDMVMCKTHGAYENLTFNTQNDTLYCNTCKENTQLAGKLYAVNGGNSFNPDLTGQKYDDQNNQLREPRVLMNSQHGDVSTTEGRGISQLIGVIGITGQDNDDIINKWDNMLQETFEQMAKSVAKNSGFYIGRYETSLNVENRAQSKINQTAMKALSWYEMYAYQKGFQKENMGVVSEMIWGCQYDQIMKFVDGKNDGLGSTFNVTVANGRNSNDEDVKTGMNKIDKVGNIFDLEGGMMESTQESVSSSNFVSVSRGIRGRKL